MGFDNFEPNRRQAILVNGLDRDWPQQPARNWTVKGFDLGSKRVQELEGLLSGTLQADGELTQNDIDQIRSQRMDDHTAGERWDTKCAMDSARPDALYDVGRVQAYENQQRGYENAIDQFRSDTTRDTLTLFYITTHGEKDGTLRIDDDYLPYSWFLDRLDTLPGKKVLFVLACFSGGIYDRLQARQLEDYNVVTSVTAHQPSYDGDERRLHDTLIEDIMERQSFSRTAKRIRGLINMQCQVGESFNVVL